MSDIDDTLQDILEDWYPGTQYVEVIELLKKAFTDAGYHTGTVTKYTLPELLASDNSVQFKPQLTMTGDAWYSRFEKELKPNAVRVSPDMIVSFRREDVLKAAKRASGIKESE